MKNLFCFLKRIALVAVFCLVGVFSVLLTACDDATINIGSTIMVGTGEPADEMDSHEGTFYMDKETFDLYVKESTGWTKLGTIKGEKGDNGNDGQPGTNGQNGVDGHDGQDGHDGLDGDYIVFDVREDGIYYKYSLESDTKYRLLTSFDELKGQDGNDGDPVVIYVQDDAIYWKYSSATAGTKIIDVADIVGSDGEKVELSTSEGYIVWKYESEGNAAWRNLIRLADISGAEGKSAYQVALDNNFAGTEEEWLESLKGEKGDDGDDGVSVEDISIRYEYDNDGNEWIYLITEYSNGERKETSAPVPKRVASVEMVTQVFAMQDEPGEMPTFHMVVYYEDGSSEELEVKDNMIISNNICITRVGVYHTKIKYKGKFAESDFVVAKDFDMNSVVEYFCLEPINTLYGALNKIILFSKNGENASAVGVVNGRSLIVGDYSIQGDRLCLEGDFFGAPSFYTMSVDSQTGLRVISTFDPAVQDETPQTFVYKIFEEGYAYSFNIVGYSNGYASISILQGGMLRSQTVEWDYDNETGYLHSFGKAFQIIDETSGTLLEVISPTNQADYILEPDDNFISSVTDKDLESAFVYSQEQIVKFVYTDDTERTYEMIFSVENENEFAIYDPYLGRLFYYVIDVQNNLISNPNYTILTPNTQSSFYNNLPSKIYVYQDGTAVLSIDGNIRRGYSLLELGDDNYYISSSTDETQNKYNSSMFITIFGQTYSWYEVEAEPDVTYTYSYTQSSNNYQRIFFVYNDIFDDYVLAIVNEYEGVTKISTRATTIFVADNKLFDISGEYNVGAENVLTSVEDVNSPQEYTNGELFEAFIGIDVGNSSVTESHVVVGDQEYPYTLCEGVLICLIDSRNYLLQIEGNTIDFYMPDTTDMDVYENQDDDMQAFVFTFDSNLYAVVRLDMQPLYTIAVTQDGDNIIVAGITCTPAL